MGKHRLSLETPDTLNCCILRVQDSSSYDEDLSITCPRLLITIPGFSDPYYVEDIASGFSLNLTACDLGIQSESCGTEFNDLPDGVYILKYSVSPHDKVYVEYNHMRTTKALNKLRKVYCSLDLENCESTPERKRKLDAARMIADLLFGAKAYVEDCREVNKGKALYCLAMEMLDKLNCTNCN